MSAFLMSQRDIDAIVNFANVEFGGQGWFSQDPQELGAILYEQNKKSVDYRYRNKNAAGGRYRWKPSGSNVVSLAQFFKLLDCLEYQSCESPDYYDSDEYKIIARLRRGAIKMVPGYEEAQWGLN